MVASDGGVFAFGDARFAGSRQGIGGCSGSAAAVMPDATGNGYWAVTQSGNVYTFGDVPYFGASGPQGVPVTSAMRTPDGRGYWILYANGAISFFGDAGMLGWAVWTRPPRLPIVWEAAERLSRPPPNPLRVVGARTWGVVPLPTRRRQQGFARRHRRQEQPRVTQLRFAAAS